MFSNDDKSVVTRHISDLNSWEKRPKSVAKASISLCPSSPNSKSHVKYGKDGEALSNCSEIADVISNTARNKKNVEFDYSCSLGADNKADNSSKLSVVSIEKENEQPNYTSSGTSGHIKSDTVICYTSAY